MDKTILSKKEKIKIVCKKINNLKKKFYNCTEHLKCVEVLFEKSGTKCIKKIKKNKQSPNREHNRNSPAPKDIFFTGFINNLDFFNAKNLDVFFDKCCFLNNKYNDKQKNSNLNFNSVHKNQNAKKTKLKKNKNDIEEDLSNKSNNTDHKIIFESPKCNNKYIKLNSRQPDENEKDFQVENKMNEMKNDDIEINAGNMYKQTIGISLNDLKNENIHCISKTLSNEDSTNDNKRRETKLYNIDSYNNISNKRRKLSEITVDMNDMSSELKKIPKQVCTQFSLEKHQNLEESYEKKENYTRDEEDQGIYSKNKYIKKQNLILKISNIIFEGIKDEKGEKTNEISSLFQNNTKRFNLLFENMESNHDKKKNIDDNIKKEYEYIVNQIDVIVNTKSQEKLENKITNYQDDLQKCLMFFNNIFLKLSVHINTLFSTCIELLKCDFSQINYYKVTELNNSRKVINLIKKYQNHQEYVIHFSKYLLQICKIFMSRNNSEFGDFDGKYIKDIISKKEIKTIKNLIKILNRWNKIDLNILLKLTQYKMENNTNIYQLKILNYDLVKHNFFVKKGDFLKYNNKIISSLKNICSLLFDGQLNEKIKKNINEIEENNQNYSTQLTNENDENDHVKVAQSYDFSINTLLNECNIFSKRNDSNGKNEIYQGHRNKDNSSEGSSSSDEDSNRDADENDLYSKCFDNKETVEYNVWKYEREMKSNEMKVIINLNKILTHEINYYEFIRNATKREVDEIRNIYIYIKKIYNFLEKNNEKGSSFDLPSTQNEYVIINKFREYLLELSINKNNKEIYMANDTAHCVNNKNKNIPVINNEENCHINFSITDDFSLLEKYNIYNNNKVVKDKYSKDAFESFETIKQNKYSDRLEENEEFKYISYKNDNDIYNLANMIKTILVFIFKYYIKSYATTNSTIYEENAKSYLYTDHEKLIVNLEENIKQINKENTKNSQKLEIEKKLVINLNKELERKNKIIKEMELSLEKLTKANNEFRLQIEKEKIVSDSVFEELEAEKGRSVKLVDELETEKGRSAKLNDELETEKERSAKLNDELETEKEKSVKLADELETEKVRSAKLNDELETEKEKSVKLADELETEKGRSVKLADELETEKGRSLKLADELETEKEKSLKLNDELETEKEKSVKLADELETEKGRSLKLNDELETEKEKSVKLADELETEKGRSLKLVDELETEKGRSAKLNDELETEKEKSVKLADELETEKGRSLKLVDELETEKEKSVKLADELETEKGRSLKLVDELETEKGRSAKLNDELETEKEKSVKLADELETEKGRSAKLNDELETEKERSAKLNDELETEKEKNAKLADELETEKGRSAKLNDELETEKEIKLADELETEKGRSAKLNDELETEKEKSTKLNGELESEKKKCEEKENKIMSQNKELEDMNKMRNDNKDKESQQNVKNTFFSRFLKKYKKNNGNDENSSSESSSSENKITNRTMKNCKFLNENEKDEYGNLYYSHIESVIKNDNLEKEYDKMILDFNSKIDNFNKKVEYFDEKIKYYKNICANYEKKYIYINNCVDKLEELIIDADEKKDNKKIKINIQNKMENLKNILKELKENYKIEMIETDSMLFDEILKEKNILLKKIHNYKISNIDNEKSEELKKYMKDMNFKTINDLFIFHINATEELNLLKDQFNQMMNNCSVKDKELTILNENCKSLLLEVDNLKSILNDLFSYKENKYDTIDVSENVYDQNEYNSVQDKIEHIDLSEYCKSRLKNKENLKNLKMPIDKNPDILSNINNELLGNSNSPLNSNNTSNGKETTRSSYKSKKQKTSKRSNNKPVSEVVNEISPKRYQLRRSSRNK
ncbi:conserved Plasmodium protein, unknown function [Plasmodium berghei]|uniref:Uncharacterized protein n=1 Tax=Plasmodium berghei TaxID=5821 RepID=A0A1D3Q3D2_PLABE|nr:conserved Plasmodium protein, unknown function [Plasmodium berghei]